MPPKALPAGSTLTGQVPVASAVPGFQTSAAWSTSVLLAVAEKNLSDFFWSCTAGQTLSGPFGIWPHGTKQRSDAVPLAPPLPCATQMQNHFCQHCLSAVTAS